MNRRDFLAKLGLAGASVAILPLATEVVADTAGRSTFLEDPPLSHPPSPVQGDMYWNRDSKEYFCYMNGHWRLIA